MANGAITIGEALTAFRGVLTGVPVWTGGQQELGNVNGAGN
jgi:hypothetical protein